MDKETAYLVLKLDSNDDLEDEFELLFFNTKKEFLTKPFHPKLFEKRKNKFQKEIEAYEVLSGIVFLAESRNLTQQVKSNDCLKEFYSHYQKRKSEIKLEINSAQNPKVFLNILEFFEFEELNWLQNLAQYFNTNFNDEVKQAQEPDPMKLFEQINLWESQNYALNLLDLDKFAVLRKEIIRANKILEK